MKYLVVNADDLGLSEGVNLGIVAAHRDGVVTSASLMVNTAASRHAADLTRDLPRLSVGLHADLSEPWGRPLTDMQTGEGCAAVLRQQIDTFQRLVGRPPTHLDAHHNLHRDPLLLPAFVQQASRYGIPLREHSPVRYLSKFYGRWSGSSHPEQISVEGLVRLLETRMSDRVTELGCHPGYCDAGLSSSYRGERETELKTLCHPVLREFLSARQIRLVTFEEAMDLLAGTNEKDGSA